MQSHLTVAAIPFTFLKEDLETIKKLIKALPLEKDFSFFDPIKYHNHIEKLIVNPLNDSSKIEDHQAFLTIYQLNKEKNVVKIESLHYNVQKNYLRIDENHRLEFTEHNYIVLNEFAEIGYFVFGFNIISLTNKGINDFADCAFFRFINEEDEKYKLKIYPKSHECQSVSVNSDGITFEFEGTNEKIFFHNESNQVEIKLEKQKNRLLYLTKEKNEHIVLKDKNNFILDRWKINTKDGIASIQNIEINSFNLDALIKKGLYASLVDFVNYEFKIKKVAQKPVLLHLFNPTNSELISNDEELELLLYRTLRIKSNKIPEAGEKLNLLTKTHAGVSFCNLMEGSSILDSNISPNELDSNKYTAHNDLFNSYFPSFLLAINQREAMIRLNEELSNFTYEELEETDKRYNETLKKITRMKKKVGLFKFKQIIHSVSFYDEIAVFYKHLYSAFEIKLLLEDNESSVKEVHEILERKEKREFENKLYWLTMFTGATGCLSIFSFLKDFFPFLIAKFPSWFLQYENFFKSLSFSLPILLMLMILLFFRKNKNN
jgi:hypothetical protein